MENSKEKDREILFKQLQGNDHKAALSAVKKLRTSGKTSDIPGLILSLKIQESEQIRKEILALLRDVNKTDASVYIIDAIKDPENTSILAGLLGVCWESKLDFTKYLEVFVSAFLSSNYEASLEAFTVIEKIFLDYDMPRNKLLSTINLLKISYPDLAENKRELALVLLDTLEGMIDINET